MKIAILGMEGEFDNSHPESGICKYMYNLYAGLNGMTGHSADKIEFKRWAKHFPWLNNIAFYVQSKFVNLSGYDIIINPAQCRPFDKPKDSFLVTTCHDFIVYFDGIDIWSSKNKLVALNRWLSEYTGIWGTRKAFKSNAIIVLSEKGKEEAVTFSKLNGLAYNKSNIHIINSISALEGKFINNPECTRQKSKIFKIGIITSFDAAKRVEISINAVMRLKGDDIIFEIWGRPSAEMEELEKQAKSDKRIVFRGIAPEDKKIQIYDSFDVVLNTGIWESMGMYEALIRGIPLIIMADCKISAELSRHCIKASNERNLSEMICKLKEDGYSEEQKRSAINFVRKHTWSSVIKQTFEVYLKVYNKNNNIVLE